MYVIVNIFFYIVFDPNTRGLHHGPYANKNTQPFYFTTCIVHMKDLLINSLFINIQEYMTIIISQHNIDSTSVRLGTIETIFDTFS